MINRLRRLFNFSLPPRSPAVLAFERDRLAALLRREWLGERTERADELIAAAETTWESDRLRELLDELEAELEDSEQAARAW